MLAYQFLKLSVGLLLIPSLAFASPGARGKGANSAANAHKASRFSQLKKVATDARRVHQDMRYVTGRGLKMYVESHEANREHIANDIAKWTSKMKILDGGAGEANFFRDIAQRGDIHPEMIAVGVKKPSTLATLPRGVRYVEGKLGGNRKLERSLGRGSFDRIVDTLGAASYSLHFDRVLKSYGQLLKPGGKVFVASEFYVAKFEDAKGKEMTLPEYLATLKGFKVIYSSKANFALQRTTETLRIPGLTLVESNSPLDRRFRLKR